MSCKNRIIISYRLTDIQQSFRQQSSSWKFFDFCFVFFVSACRTMSLCCVFCVIPTIVHRNDLIYSNHISNLLFFSMRIHTKKWNLPSIESSFYGYTLLTMYTIHHITFKMRFCDMTSTFLKMWYTRNFIYVSWPYF